MCAILKNKRQKRFSLPEIEKTTFDVSLVYFLLMFGYKIFSLYYPLFLVSLGLSVINVGWIYLLIYATIAFASIFVGFYLHRINPAKAACVGILGYAVYALLMLATTNLFVFYLAQILLGISAALWLTSFKAMIIDSAPRNYNSSFGWFYSAPEYASAFAPVVGGLVIYKFGFEAVFALSVLIQTANAVYAYFRLDGKNGKSFDARKKSERKIFKLRDSKNNFAEIFRRLGKDKGLWMPLAAFSLALVLGGAYRPYMILFLNDMKYQESQIIGLISILSLAFIPLSFLVIKFIAQAPSKKNIIHGVMISGIVFMIIGSYAKVLGLDFIFLLLLLDMAAGLAAGSGKSAVLAEKFAALKEEISTVDTVLITLFPALGGIIGGFMVYYLGYGSTFFLLGTLVFVAGLASRFKPIRRS